MTGIKTFLAVVLYLLLIILLNIRFSASKSTSFSLQLIHRDSPESPLHPGNLSLQEKLKNYIQISEARASYLTSIATNDTSLQPNMMRPPVFPDWYLYMVKIGIGNPVRILWFLLDTGAGLTWTQCQPCTSCYKQKDPTYDSRVSKSYEKIPCYDASCKAPFSCFEGECFYDISYGDGSQTKGVSSWETFTFAPPEEPSPVSVQNIRFGCSYDSKDFGFIWRGNIAGILGLNWDPNSMIVQLGRLVLNRFSYCLVQPDKSFHSYLKFGDEMYDRRGDQFQTTSFVKQPNSYVYGLNLLDISIGGKRLNLPPNTFSIKPDGQGGCMIDSGSVLTIIEYEVYLDLRTAFTEYFARYDIERLTTCPNYGVLCFKLPAGFNSFPSMTYHFQGADLDIEPENVFIINNQDSYFFPAITPRKGKTVLGAWQQHNTRFVYDLDTFQLYFAPENCAQDRG